jgi:hypothetical protein
VIKILAGAVVALSLMAAPALARNFAVPEKNPAITLSVPDSWEVEESEYGYSAFSPGKDVFFSVEYARSRQVKPLMDATAKWMKDNRIKAVEPVQAETKLNGMDATVFQFETSDENGPTTVELILVNGGKDHMVMFTLWGSDKERAKHGAAVDGIMKSVKRID